jgi:glutamyl-tRNA reductase
MSEIVLIGMNHKTAPVAIRECVALTGDGQDEALETLARRTEISEVMVVSTCNRVEVLMAAEQGAAAAAAAKQYLAETNGMPLERFEDALYELRQEEAVRHIFRVAASLDSMMVGEPQILGQIKEAYRLATRKKCTGVILNRLLHRSFFVAKRVRSETGVGDHAVSISYAAIELARKIFGQLEGKTVLLIGAGEMAELAVEHLVRNRVAQVQVANRTFERGLALAERFHGRALRFEEIADALREADIIISSTGFEGYVVVREQVRSVMRSRKNRPLFFIDIAVPRDIDPEINRVTNAYVYDIDDLKEIIEENIEDRQREAVRGERIVDEAVIRFRQWRESLDVVPTIVALREKMEGIAREEVDRTLGHLPNLSEPDRAALDRMIGSLVNKMLHNPIQYLKQEGGAAEKQARIDTVRKLFGLDPNGAGRPDSHSR